MGKKEYVRFGHVLIPCVDVQARRLEYTKHAIGWFVAGAILGIAVESWALAFILWTVAALVFWNGYREPK